MALRFFKQSAALEDYDFDWSAWLVAGDFITTFTVMADTGVTLGASVHQAQSPVITQFVSGGTHGNSYKVTCAIQTSQGRSDTAEIIIIVRDVGTGGQPIPPPAPPPDPAQPISQLEVFGLNLGAVPAVNVVSDDSTMVGFPGPTAVFGKAIERGNGGDYLAGVSGVAENHGDNYNLFGVDAEAYSMAGVITNIIGGVYSYCEIRAGSVPYMIGMNPDSNANFGGTVENNYGIRVEDQNAGLNNFGCWDHQTAGPNNWAFYAEGDARSYFGGNLIVKNVPVFANNAAAISGGLGVGELYRTGADPDPVCIVH